MSELDKLVSTVTHPDNEQASLDIEINKIKLDILERRQIADVLKASMVKESNPVAAG